jgi:hypothetical protein
MGHPGLLWLVECGRAWWGSGFLWMVEIGRLDLEFACAGGPLRFDFYGVGFAGGVVVEAAPTVVFRFSNEAAVTGLRWMYWRFSMSFSGLDTLKS